jgi:hypothetical protein
MVTRRVICAGRECLTEGLVWLTAHWPGSVIITAGNTALIGEVLVPGRII